LEHQSVREKFPTEDPIKKRCLSCGVQFALSGSGKRQKYCSKCARRGDGQGRGLPASKTLKTKGAEEHLWTPIPPGPNRSPIQFTTPEGDKGRIWVSDRKDREGEDVYWRSAIAEAKKRAASAAMSEANRSRFDSPVDLLNGRQRGRVKLRKAILDTELVPPLKGFLVRLYFELEAPDIGCGQRLVLCQFRGKKIRLYHYREDGQWMRSTTVRRDVFKDLVAANKRRRIKAQRPQLKLVVSNPPKFDERVSDAA
jgi:hypothetical protein